MRGARIGLNVGIGLVLIFAVACTSDGGSGPMASPSAVASTDPVTSSSAPPTSSSAAPTSSSPSVPTTGPNVRPGEKVPTLPVGADSNSRQGAVQFAQYWFEALDWGYATTSTALAKELYLRQCDVCAEFTRDVDNATAKARHFEGGRISVQRRQIVLNDGRHPGTTVVDVYFDVTPIRTIDRNGKVVSRGDASKDVRWRLWLSWQVNRWTVLDMKRVLSS